MSESRGLYWHLAGRPYWVPPVGAQARTLSIEGIAEPSGLSGRHLLPLSSDCDCRVRRTQPVSGIGGHPLARDDLRIFCVLQKLWFTFLLCGSGPRLCAFPQQRGYSAYPRSPTAGLAIHPVDWIAVRPAESPLQP